jgi:phosphoribosylamine--glycine ligase
MRILVVGSGGREAALVQQLRKSMFVDDILCAPGNAGIALHAKCMPVGIEDTWGLLKLAEEKEVDLTVVGSELPLVRGMVDLFEQRGKRIIGPSARAARIEGSKAYAKKTFQRYQIPTAEFEIFANPQKAKQFIRKQNLPLVIKPDGLSGGKGVTIAYTLQEAFNAVENLLSIGERIVIEEYLTGIECSYVVFTDGENILALPPALDYKETRKGSRIMTGGMGCVAPHPFFARERLERKQCIETMIIFPLLQALLHEGRPYRGILYAGLMLTAEGPKVLEINCRFGDPEAQTTLPLLRYPDMVPLFLSTIAKTNNLKFFQAEWKNGAAVCVVLAAEGYPAKFRKGDVITGIEEAMAKEDILVFHAGTDVLPDGTFITARPRVLNVVGFGSSMTTARERAYEAVRCIRFSGMWYREDIGEFSFA